MPSRLIRCAAAVAWGIALLLPAAAASGQDLHAAAADLVVKYAADLEALACWCEARGLSGEARQTRLALPPRDPYKLYLPILPDEVGPPCLPAGAPAEAVEWDARLWKLRRAQATALFELARRAVRAGQAALAFDLALAAVHANPDYEPVRRLLGYQSYEGRWQTAYAVRKLRAGGVWHERFGWLPKAHVARYEQGERHANGRWIGAADDGRLHADIRSGWDVETEHYTIRTNHSIEAGVALGEKLERLYRLWCRMFIRYFASEADVVALFEGRARSPRSNPPRFDVVYFRDRDDYVRSLRAAMPNIDISIGAYVERTRRAYFFAGEEGGDRTIYHEAVHQLFHQSRPVDPNVGRDANFWIIEGIAMYMESLREEDGYYVLGGLDDERMHAARYRLLNDRFYVPLAELSGYGIQRIQQHPRIATLYSQSAGLAHFLIHHDGGRYRDALVAYLALIYSGRDDPGTLARLTHSSYPELDRQYREFAEGKEAGRANDE